MDNLFHVGNKIKSIRKQYKLTQIEFAQSLEISQGTLSEIESGKAKPSFDALVLLADNYKVDMNWLIINSNVELQSGLQNDELAILNNYRNLEELARVELLEYSQFKLQRYRKKS